MTNAPAARTSHLIQAALFSEGGCRGYGHTGWYESFNKVDGTKIIYGWLLAAPEAPGADPVCVCTRTDEDARENKELEPIP